MYYVCNKGLPVYWWLNRLSTSEHWQYIVYAHTILPGWNYRYVLEIRNSFLQHKIFQSFNIILGLNKVNSTKFMDHLSGKNQTSWIYREVIEIFFTWKKKKKRISHTFFRLEYVPSNLGITLLAKPSLHHKCLLAAWS